MELLDILITPSHAASSEGGMSSLGGLPFLFIIFGLMYFLLIRPQQKRAKAHKKLLAELKKGDEVVTNGGVVGIIKVLEDSFVIIEIADNVIVKVLRQSINQKMPKGTLNIKSGNEKENKKLLHKKTK